LQPEPPAKPYGSENQSPMPSAIRVYSPWIVVHEPRKVRTPRTSWFEHDADASRAPSRWAKGIVCSTLADGSDTIPGRGAIQIRSMAREQDSQGGGRYRGRRPGYMPPKLWRDPLHEGLLASGAPETDALSAETEVQESRAATDVTEESCTATNVTEVPSSCTASSAIEVADEGACPATPGTVGAEAITDARAAACAEAPDGGTMPPRLPRWVMSGETAGKRRLQPYGSLRHVIPRCISRASGHNKRCGSLRIPSCLHPCLCFLGRT